MLVLGLGVGGRVRRSRVGSGCKVYCLPRVFSCLADARCCVTRLLNLHRVAQSDLILIKAHLHIVIIAGAFELD